MKFEPVVALLGLICLTAFLFLIDYAARLLRPVSLVKRVGDEGLRVIENVYPEKAAGEPVTTTTPEGVGRVERTVLHRGKSAIVLAVNLPRLVEEAKKANGVIEFAPQVGDFVGAGEPLFLLHGGAVAIDDDCLPACVIFGSERTMEQDPLFAIASWWTSRSRRSPRQSMIRPPPCSRSISFIDCCAAPVVAISGLTTSSIRPEPYASSFGHRIGLISSTSPSSRFDFTAHRISRSRGDSAR